MGFIEEITGCFDAELSPAFRVVMFGEKAAYLEGVKAIKSYSAEKIEITVKNGELKITGEELFVKKYCAGDMAICGKIKRLEKI